MAIVVPNSALLTLRWSSTTRPWMNVIGVLGSGALPPITQALVDAVHTGITTSAGFISLLAQLADTVVYESTALRSIALANQPEFVSAGAPVGGASATEMLPLNVAACVTIRTAFAGKSFRGRTYFSGFSEAANDATGRQNAAVNTAIFNAMTSINSILATNGMTIAVVSRNAEARTIPAKTFPARPGVATPVQSFQARNTKWESQRRRTGRD